MIDFNGSEIAAYYSNRVPGLKQTSHREWRGTCPVHRGSDDNFAVDSRTGRAFCHSQCSRGWDLISLEQDINASDFRAAKRSVFDIVGRPLLDGEEDIEATYDYHGSDGKVSYQVVRKYGKKFLQRRPDGIGGWKWGLGAVGPIPFRLPRVMAAEYVAIVEGEKDAVNLEREGWAATCNNGGAGNFKPELAKWFEAKHVLILPDFDEPGRRHALKVAELLLPVAASVKIVELPNLPPKGDVSDYLARGGSVDEIYKLYEAAQEWTPEWQFSADLKSEHDRYVRTLAETIREHGGRDGFWDFTAKAGVPTPWQRLTDALGGGMRAGEVYVLGGNQGSGKTSLALQFVVRALRGRCGVLMFSMEMGHRDVFQRLVSMEAKVDLLEYRQIQNSRGYLDGLRLALDTAEGELTGYSLLVSTKPSVTPDFVTEESARLRKRQPIHLIVVDHMQLMAAAGSVRGDYEKFTAISRAMKQTSQEIETPILLVSQTTRLNATDRRAELEVSDLRGSGAIEEDAAAVMLLFEDKEDSTQAKARGHYAKGPVKSWLKIGKNRYGLSGAFLCFQHFKCTTRFDPYESEDRT